MQSVGPRDRGGEVVDDEIVGNTTEESPGRLQPVDDVFQLLAKGGPHETVPGIGQHHDQRPHRAVAAGLWVRRQSQASEVQLRHLTRCTLCHPNGPGIAPTPVAIRHEAMQRSIGHPTIPLRQQLQDARHLQPVDGEPLIDLVCPGNQLVLGWRGHRPRTGTTDRRQPIQLQVGGRRSLVRHAQPLRRGDVSSDGLP